MQVLYLLQSLNFLLRQLHQGFKTPAPICVELQNPEVHNMGDYIGNDLICEEGEGNPGNSDGSARPASPQRTGTEGGRPDTGTRLGTEGGRPDGGIRL